MTVGELIKVSPWCELIEVVIRVNGCGYEYPDDTHDLCPACGQAIRWPQEDS